MGQETFWLFVSTLWQIELVRLQSLVCRWIVTAWLLLSCSFRPLTRPHPFTGTDWTCNRQGAVGQVTWQRVLRQTARHFNLLADEISVLVTVSAYSHIAVGGDTSEHCKCGSNISACFLKKRLWAPSVFVSTPVLNCSDTSHFISFITYCNRLNFVFTKTSYSWGVQLTLSRVRFYPREYTWWFIFINYS